MGGGEYEPLPGRVEKQRSQLVVVMKISIVSYPPNTTFIAHICVPRTPLAGYRVYFVYPQSSWTLSTMHRRDKIDECAARGIAVDLLMRSDTRFPKRQGDTLHFPSMDSEKLFFAVAVPDSVGMVMAKRLIHQIANCTSSTWEDAEQETKPDEQA